jgi:hypothetical protein
LIGEQLGWNWEFLSQIEASSISREKASISLYKVPPNWPSISKKNHKETIPTSVALEEKYISNGLLLHLLNINWIYRNAFKVCLFFCQLQLKTKIPFSFSFVD